MVLDTIYTTDDTEYAKRLFEQHGERIIGAIDRFAAAHADGPPFVPVLYVEHVDGGPRRRIRTDIVPRSALRAYFRTEEFAPIYEAIENWTDAEFNPVLVWTSESLVIGHIPVAAVA